MVKKIEKLFPQSSLKAKYGYSMNVETEQQEFLFQKYKTEIKRLIASE